MTRSVGWMKSADFLFAVAVIEVALLSPAYPAGAAASDWPCVQPKVPQMSAAAMWDGPSIADVGDSWEDNSTIRDLVARLAARRTPLDVAKAAITDFVNGDDAQKRDKAKKLFAGVFDTLNQQRGQIISGLERVDRKQKDLADKIRSDVKELHALEDAPEQDQARINALGGQIEWSTRIFEDRRKTIRYVCETPTAIEQRLFALGRAIRQTLD
jgi:hypothetical protein